MKIIIILLAFISFAFSNIGKVSVVVGDAQIERNKQFIIIKSGTELEEKDIIRTAKNSKVQLIFKDNTIITVGKNSALNINKYLYDLKNPKNSKTDFSFFKGAFKTITGKIGKINKKRFKLRTKTASIGIRGTIIVGNQDMIACTQGGITVEAAGVSVNVDANELTVMQSNNAPSKAKTISKEDIKSLENSIEPESTAKKEDVKEEAKEEKSEEKKANNSEETEESEESQNNNEQVLEPEEPEIKETVKKVVEDDSNKNTPVVDPSKLAEETLLKNSVSHEKKINENVADVSTLANNVNTTLESLPNTEDSSNVTSTTSTALASVSTSLSTAITSLNNASASSTVNSAAITNVSSSISTANTLAASALADASAFDDALKNTHNQTLSTALTHAQNAKVSYDKAVKNSQDLQEVLTQAQAQNASASTIASIQERVDEANTLLLNAKTASDDALNKVNTIQNTLNQTAANSLSDAQEAVNNASTLSKLSDLLTSLEDTKQASIDANTAKVQAQTSKNNVQSSSNGANAASQDLLSAKQTITNARNTVITASNDVTSATNTATNGATKNVQVAYSARIAEDKATLAKTNADLALANASTTASKLVLAQNYVNSMNTQLSSAQTALGVATQKLSDAQSALNSAISTESSIASSNTSAKSSAQAALVKAQSLYDSALLAKAQAQTAVNEAQTIVTTLDETNFISTLTNANNEAQNDATAANNTANSALSTAGNATLAAKTASANVKTVMLAKTKKSLDKDSNKNDINNESDTFVLSPVETNKKNIGSTFGGYEGSTELGVFKTNENDINPSFRVQADNLQEFFVLYNSSTNANTSLTTYGDATTHTFDTSKIYIYKSFKTLNSNSGTGTFSSETTLHFYNPELNSYTSLSKDFFKTGASEFVVGNKTTVNTIENKFVTGSDVFIDSITTNTGVGTNTIQGSQAQGLTQNIVNSGDFPSYEQSASFLNGKSDTDSSANKSLSGRVQFVTYEPGSTGTRGEDIQLNITNDGKNIDGAAKYGNGNTIMSFSGNITDLSSYYINSDIFGVKASGIDSDENGFLKAVPDGGLLYDENGDIQTYANGDSKFAIFDENDNPLTSNDDSSWGYWSGKDSITTSVTASLGPQSVWVAGVETATSVLDNLRDGASQTLTFNGKVLGSVNYNDAILMDASNRVKIDFQVGGGSTSMSGNMQFKTVNDNFDLSMNFNTVNSSGFSGKFDGADDSFNYFGGKYYGDGEVKSIGGNFAVRENGNTATGVFKATKE